MTTLRSIAGYTLKNRILNEYIRKNAMSKICLYGPGRDRENEEITLTEWMIIENPTNQDHTKR